MVIYTLFGVSTISGSVQALTPDLSQGERGIKKKEHYE
jgi:hypothetical protein